MSDAVFFKNVVAQDGHALFYAADSLKADPEVVKIAVAQDGGALEYAAETLKADPEFVKIAGEMSDNGQDYKGPKECIFFSLRFGFSSQFPLYE